MFSSNNKFLKNIGVFLLMILVLGGGMMPDRVISASGPLIFHDSPESKVKEAMDYLKLGTVIYHCGGIPCVEGEMVKHNLNRVEYKPGDGKTINELFINDEDYIDVVYAYFYSNGKWINLGGKVGLPLQDGVRQEVNLPAPPAEVPLNITQNSEFVSLSTKELAETAKQFLDASEKVMMFCEPCKDPSYKMLTGIEYSFGEKDGEPGQYFFKMDGVESDKLPYIYIYADGGWENLAMKLGLSPKGVSASLLEEKLSGPTGCYCYIDGDKSVKDIVMGVMKKSECEDLAKSSGAEFGGQKVSECVWNQSSEVDEEAVITPSGISPLISGVTGIDKLNIFGKRTLNDIVGKILRAVIGLMGSIAFVMFVYGGLTYMVAMGNAEKKKKAQKIMIWTALGLFVILGSYTILAFVMQILPL